MAISAFNHLIWFVLVRSKLLESLRSCAGVRRSCSVLDAQARESEVELVSVLLLLAFRGGEQSSKRLAMEFDGEVKVVPAMDMTVSESSMAVGWRLD